MSKINIWADIFNEWDYNGDDLFYAPLKSVIESAEQLLDTISSIQPGQSAVLIKERLIGHKEVEKHQHTLIKKEQVL